MGKVYAHPGLTEGWGLVVQRGGHYKSLTPHIFPFSGTREEAQERVRIRCGQDPAFRARFSGCWIVPLRFDDAIQVREEISQMRNAL